MLHSHALDNAGGADRERDHREGGEDCDRNPEAFDLLTYRRAATITTSSGGDEEHTVNPRVL